MRVGVFLGDFKPDVGGGYTFVNDVAEAFFAHMQSAAHQFFVFCPPDAAAVLRGLHTASNLTFVPLARRGLFGKAISTLKHLSPVFAILWRWPSALERKAKSLGVETIWFVGGFFDTPDIPYIAMVWDVQHRTHPWFPEVSAKGRWDYRERFMARHLRRAARVITGSHIGKQELMSFYQLPENRITILPHPTPTFALMGKGTDKQTILGKFNLREGFLLYPAQFWAHKNHVNLLHGLAKLRERGGQIPDLALVGSDKGNKAHVLQLAAKLGIADKVHALGFVSVEELVGLYKAATAMVYPSFSGPENLPPLEAFALQCPVMNSEFPGAREQLGEAATYFNPHDPESIADAIADMLRDDAMKNQRVALGLKRARAWTGKEFVHGVMNLIDEWSYEQRCW